MNQLKTISNDIIVLFKSNHDFYSDPKIREQIIDKIFNENTDLHQSKEQCSFFDAIKSSITNYMYPITSNIIKTVCNYNSISTILEIIENYKKHLLNQNDGTTLGSSSTEVENYNLIKMYIKTTKLQYSLSDNISVERILQPITISPSKFESSKKHPKVIFGEFYSYLIDHPIEELIHFIAGSKILFLQFKEDFITRSLGISQDLKDLFIYILESMIPYTITNDQVERNINEQNLILPLSQIPNNQSAIENCKEKLSNHFNDFNSNIEDIKFMILESTINLISKELKIITNEIQIIGWVKIVKNLFNKINIEKLFSIILNQPNQQELMTLLAQIHSSHLLFIHILQSNPPIKNIQFLLSNSIPIFQSFDLNDIMVTYLKMTRNLNDPHPFNIIILDIIKPLIQLNDKNLFSFINIVNGCKMLSKDLINSIPVGWSTLIIKDIIGNGNDSIRNQLILDHQIEKTKLETIFSPLTFLNNDSIKHFIKLFNLKNQEIGQLNLLNQLTSQNQDPLINIIYHISFESYKERSSSIEMLIEEFNQVESKTESNNFNVYERISFVSLNSINGNIQRVLNSFNGTALDVYSIIASTWSAMSFTASIRNYPFAKYRNFIHFPGDSNNPSDYILQRSLVAIKEIELNSNLKQLLIDPLVYISRYTMMIWSESFNIDNNGIFRDSFISQSALTYERKLFEITNTVINQYNQIKSRLLESSFESNQKLSIISLQMFYQNLIYKTIPECIDYLIKNQYETIETIVPLKIVFEEVIKVWVEIKEKVSVEICPNALQNESIITNIDRTTPLINMIWYDSQNGWLVKVMDEWLSNTQSKLIEQSISNGNLSNNIINLMKCNNKIDMAEIPLEIGSENLLIGANFETDDFNNFYSLLISNSIILNYLYGKVLRNQFNKFKSNFKFKKIVVNNQLLNNNNNNYNNLIEPEFIKEIKYLKEKVSKLIELNHEKLDENVKIKITSKFNSKLNPNQLESFGRNLIEILNSILKQEDLKLIKSKKLNELCEQQLNIYIIELLKDINSNQIVEFVIFS
ncbi:hypothetical protein ACTFIY_005435 [Dictyostelium cf. discoideum]